MNDLKNLLAAARESYGYKLIGAGSVPANSSAVFSIAVGADGHFEAQEMTAQFTTLTGAAADGGANGLSLMIWDDGRDLRLFNDFIPLSLLASPGRQRASGVAGDPSNQLFFPLPFNYLFLAQSTIRLELRSVLAYANDFALCFHGLKHLITPGKA
jgi:hypothetical protein